MKDGKIFSYRFRARVGRDKNNKQIFRTTTWTVPEELVPSKAERAAHKAAAQLEESVRAEYKRDLLAPNE